MCLKPAFGVLIDGITYYTLIENFMKRTGIISISKYQYQLYLAL